MITHLLTKEESNFIEDFLLMLVRLHLIWKSSHNIIIQLENPE